MRIVDTIRRKRDGARLSDGELRDFVAGVTRGDIPDYQISALLMAIFLRGLDSGELGVLTDAMLHSGRVLDFSDLSGAKVDKHSTGGVGDKISIALAPAVAACGVRVPMISGRGLGHSGGTLDKLESIPGFRTDLDAAKFRSLLGTLGLVLAGQSDDLAPADRRLYALRDVTGTIESIPLIAASIMSKKLAEGIDALVLDVKVGGGAFMKTAERARELARTLVGIGKAAGKQVTAFMTDMNQPIGHAVGNFNEVYEAVDVLRGSGPADTRELTVTLGAEMLRLGHAVDDAAAGRARMERALDSGEALECFLRLVTAQGGDESVFTREPRYAPHQQTITAPRSGHVTTIDAEAIGVAAVMAGAGRARKEDRIDPTVALFVHARIGDRVQAGSALATLHTATAEPGIAHRIAGAFAIGDAPQAAPRLVQETIS
jgi:pyrimidine-nucleoside phosphorylase